MVHPRHRGLRLLAVIGMLASLIVALPAAVSAQQVVQVTVNDGKLDPGVTSCQTFEPDYTSIQAAIDAAGPGTTVKICPGDYAENVTINKNVPIVGSFGARVVPVDQSLPAVTVTVSGASVEEPLTIQMLETVGGRDGFYLNNVSNVSMLAVGASAAAQNGIVLNGTLNNIDLAACVFNGNDNLGVRVPASAAIDGFSMNFCQVNGNSGGFGMYGSLRNAMISNTEFNGNLGTPSAYTGGYGIVFNLGSPNPQVVDNVQFDAVSASDNGDSKIGAGLQLAPYAGDSITNVTITNSTFVGNRSPTNFSRALSIELIDQNENPVDDPVVDGVTIEGSTFSGSTFGIVVGWADDTPDGAPQNLSVHNSVITGNSQFGLANFLSANATVDAICNYWGAADGPSGAGSGSGDAVTEGVDYLPWNTSAESTACDGFPVITACANRWNGALRFSPDNGCTSSEREVVWQTGSGAGGTITVCANSWNGDARYSPSGSCAAGETLISWDRGDGEGPQIEACVNRWNSSMRISGRCSWSETSLSWNQDQHLLED